MKNDGGPAFPLEYSTFQYHQNSNTERIFHHQTGLSLRDYFAAKAMQGIASDSTFNPVDDYEITISKLSYQIADAMLEAREKWKPKKKNVHGSIIARLLCVHGIRTRAGTGTLTQKSAKW
jgi:hypothetical protein